MKKSAMVLSLVLPALIAGAGTRGRTCGSSASGCGCSHSVPAGGWATLGRRRLRGSYGILPGDFPGIHRLHNEKQSHHLGDAGWRQPFIHYLAVIC